MDKHFLIVTVQTIFMSRKYFLIRLFVRLVLFGWIFFEKYAMALFYFYRKYLIKLFSDPYNAFQFSSVQLSSVWFSSILFDSVQFSSFHFVSSATYFCLVFTHCCIGIVCACFVLCYLLSWSSNHFICPTAKFLYFPWISCACLKHVCHWTTPKIL